MDPQRLWSIDISSKTKDNFYPVVLEQKDYLFPINFKVTGTQSLDDNDNYNNCTLIGYYRAGGSSDKGDFWNVRQNCHDIDERRFYGIHTSNKHNFNVVIYMRGGYSYSITTDSPNVELYPDGYYSPHSIVNEGVLYPIKQANGTNIGTNLILNNGDIEATIIANGIQRIDLLNGDVDQDYTNSTFNISSAGDAFLKITGDNTNSDGTKHPYLIFQQDGGYNEAGIFLGTGDTNTGDTNENDLIISASTNGGGNIHFLTDTTSGQNDDISNLEGAPTRMTITDSGNVGIGTTSPSAKLHIYEPNGTTGSGNGVGSLVIEHGNTGGSSSIVFVSAKNKTSDYGYIRYQDDRENNTGSERSVLTIGTQNDADDNIALMASGSVGINKLSPNNSYELDVNGDVNATSYNASSDYRIKENVVPISDTSYNIDNIRPVTYTNTKMEKQDFGVIAHELQEQIPFLVNGEKDGEHHQSVNYNGLIGLLLNEVQQLKKRVQELEQSKP